NPRSQNPVWPNFLFRSTNLGIAEYLDKNYEQAQHILTECIPHRTKRGLAVCYLYRGQSYWESGQQRLAIQDFETLDSLLNNSDATGYFKELRWAYTALIDYYSEKEDRAKQLKYINGYIRTDSILDEQYKSLTDIIHKDYDKVKLSRQKEEIILSMHDQQKKTNQLFYVTIFSVTIFFVLAVYYYLQRRRYKRKFKELVAPKTLSKKQEPESKIDGLSAKNIKDIRDQLALFERKEAFLSNTVNLQGLSKQLGTNANYLSKVINHDYKKNFTTYINELRIDYVVHRLRVDAKFRKYTIRSIAEEIGFNNPESFSKAFLKKTGIYPSFFIKQLEKEGSPHKIYKNYTIGIF
ncbi:MAG: helix-turn-helix domain-containing protein, partial [Bacteroidota bacterium]